MHLLAVSRISRNRDKRNLKILNFYIMEFLLKNFFDCCVTKKYSIFISDHLTGWNKLLCIKMLGKRLEPPDIFRRCVISADQCPHARSSDIVNRNSGVNERFDDSDMGKPLCPAPAERESDFLRLFFILNHTHETPRFRSALR